MIHVLNMIKLMRFELFDGIRKSFSHSNIRTIQGIKPWVQSKMEN